jgi:hypothetical protein
MRVWHISLEPAALHRAVLTAKQTHRVNSGCPSGCAHRGCASQGLFVFSAVLTAKQAHTVTGE